MLTMRQYFWISYIITFGLLTLGQLACDLGCGIQLILESGEGNDSMALCDQDNLQSQPTYGVITLIIACLPSIYAPVFVLLNGGYYIWAAISMFAYWPLCGYTIYGAFKGAIKNFESNERRKHVEGIKVILAAQCWLQAAPQLILQTYIIWSGIHPGPWQISSLVFSSSVLIVYVLNYHFSNILIEELDQHMSTKSMLKLYSETFIHQVLATSYRIITPLTLIFFLKSYSLIPLILGGALQTMASWMATKDFQKSILASFTFFCPLQLGHQGMTRTFARISSHLIVFVGCVCHIILCICYSQNLMESDSESGALAISECSPRWIRTNPLKLIIPSLMIGVIYSMLTEFLICKNSKVFN